VNNDCPVHHRTVRWPRCQKLQRSESNGRVTWLAHRTVSGGALDCPMRHATDSLPTATFGGWGYKYPNHPPFIASKFSAFKHLTRAIAFNTRHNQRDQILSQVPRSFELLRLDCFSSSFFLVFNSIVTKARDTNCVVVLVGTWCPV
jgi:hypothetical protein